MADALIQPSSTDTVGVETGGVDAFGLIYDNLLEHDAQRTWEDTVLLGLLYRCGIYSDSWSATNRGLKEVLMGFPGGHLLLAEGVLRIARRDTAESFAGFLAQSRTKKMHGLIDDGGDAYAAFLDRHANGHLLVFSGPKVGNSYREMSAKVADVNLLTAIGMSPASAELAVKIIEEAKNAGTYQDTNTFIKDHVCPCLQKDADRELAMTAFRAPVQSGVAWHVSLGRAGHS